MKFAIIKERKNPPDRRVVFSPSKLAEARIKFPQANFVVESSDIRVFLMRHTENLDLRYVMMFPIVMCLLV